MSEQVPPPQNAALPTRRSLLPGTLALLALLGIAALGYQQLQQRAALADLRGELAALRQFSGTEQARLDELLGEQEAIDARLRESLEAALSASRAEREAQESRLEALNRELVNLRLRLNDSGAGASQAWMLSEAESLLRLAQQRLLTARDVRAAIGLFITADDLLRQLNDPAVFAVREVLTQELAALQALPEVDVQGLYLQLGAQSALIDELAVVQPGATTAFTLPAAERTLPADPGWLARVQASLDRYFVVSRRDEAVAPLLSAEQENRVRRAIQLRIEEARVALLRGQPELYRAALDEARREVGARLRGEAGAHEALQQTLAALRDTPILVELPPVGNTLNALRRLQPAAGDQAGAE